MFSPVDSLLGDSLLDIKGFLNERVEFGAVLGVHLTFAGGAFEEVEHDSRSSPLFLNSFAETVQVEDVLAAKSYARLSAQGSYPADCTVRVVIDSWKIGSILDCRAFFYLFLAGEASFLSAVLV